jgi:hypothetical protein
MQGKYSRKIMKSTRGVAVKDGIAEAKAGLDNTVAAAICSWATAMAKSQNQLHN